MRSARRQSSAKVEINTAVAFSFYLRKSCKISDSKRIGNLLRSQSKKKEKHTQQQQENETEEKKRVSAKTNWQSAEKVTIGLFGKSVSALKNLGRWWSFSEKGQRNERIDRQQPFLKRQLGE